MKGRTMPVNDNERRGFKIDEFVASCSTCMSREASLIGTDEKTSEKNAEKTN